MIDTLLSVLLGYYAEDILDAAEDILDGSTSSCKEGNDIFKTHSYVTNDLDLKED